VSALGLAALAVAQADLDAGVRGGGPGFGRFDSPEVAARLAAVGIKYPAPWCAAEVFHCFEVARGEQALNPCPRTAGAFHLWELATTRPPFAAVAKLPAPGDVFVLVHSDGIHGHTGIVESASPDGKTITTVEGDTSPDGQHNGDQMGRHTWKPADGKRGKLLGYLEFGA
jgi:hypothetical protein